MKIQESGENYLETILLLQNNSELVRAVDIATTLGYSKPSVSRALGILKQEGLLMVGEGGNILLTEKGKRRAERIYERHCIIAAFLKMTLQVPAEMSDIAEKDACRIEHIISEEMFQRMKQVVADHGTM